jgi:hypothetical protein
MTLQRGYCAELALAEGATLPGTADVVDAWIMLEYLPAWTAKATADNSLASATRAWLDGLTQAVVDRGLKPRLQLIRRPELDRTGVTLMLALDGALHRVEAVDYDALCGLSLQDMLAREPIEHRQYFVCTNGQRDLCCARFGLPTYAALRERVGERVWQTTHVGGHRFAANVLTLPQAAMYGRVQPGDVDTFLDAVENDRLAAPWLRGRTRYAPEVQAAEAALIALGIDTAGAVSTQSLGDGAVRVVFGAHGARVRPGVAVDVQASCGDEKRKSAAPLIVSVET